MSQGSKTIRPATARRLLFAILLLSFLLPYFSVKLYETVKDGEWRASGLSPYEIDRWRENGFGGPAEALRWKDAKFKPPGASLWKKEGIEPETARRWNEFNFWPREALRWQELGFSPEDAAPWRDAGFLYQDAKKWRDAGVGAAEAVKKRKKGVFSP